jgi:lipopolysaccharide export system protein LptA
MTRLLWACAALALSATVASAQGIDLSSGGPVSVTARDGFEWRENQQVVIASGEARAARGDVTVLADRLIAHYRKKAGDAAVPPAASAAKPAAVDPGEGGNEVYRLEAEGNVRIVTPTDEAVGDRAVYDIDQAVLVMTGKAMKLTTPQQVMTARDSMEYWSQRHMAVGRGNAVVLTADGRRLAADTLVGYTAPDTPGTATKPPPVATATARTAPDPLAGGSGKLQRVEGFGNIELRTQADTVRGDRGVYVADTGMARVIGHVRITHGDNQVNGPAADVNMKTGIAHILSSPTERVQGMIMPNAAQGAAGAPAAKPAP